MVTMTRPDVDIVEAIDDIIAHYPPARRDQHHIHVSAQGGHVILTGNVMSPNTRAVLLEQIPSVEGVQSVNADKLYDDESIRLDVGGLIESGSMFVRIEYGIVVLSGRLPAGKTAEDYARKIAKVPGVRKVVTNFQAA